MRSWIREARNFALINTAKTKEAAIQIAEICNSMDTFAEKGQWFDLEEPFRASLPEIIWKSVLLAFTLWYGGQSFSLREKEFEAELALNHNVQLRKILEQLQTQSVFFKKETGLIVIDPRFKTNVDLAMLFLISLGANLTAQLDVKRGFQTIQSGFLQYSKIHHHPMAYLAENVRSYVSDYCQRVFGKVFKVVNESGSQMDYSLLRRFITRLSLFSFLDFVVSSDKEIENLVYKLESLRAVVFVADRYGQKYIFLKGEIMND
jgi:hypothetical protein